MISGRDTAGHIQDILVMVPGQAAIIAEVAGTAVICIVDRRQTCDECAVYDLIQRKPV